MKHSFKYNCYDVETLLGGVNRLREFKLNLKRQAELKPKVISPNVYKGDAFEAFVEVLINTQEFQEKFSLFEYIPSKENSYGVDGVAVYKKENINVPARIQIKYQDDSAIFLFADNLSNFVAHSLTEFKGKREKVHMVLITGADGIYKETATELYCGRLNVIGHPEICALVDNNSAFWDRFRYEMTQTEGENDFYS